MALDWWYDAQLRRYWIQFARIFENFQYKEGIGENGVAAFRTFPVRLAGKDKQIGHILRNNSENTLMSCPRITVEMTNMSQSDDRRQSPNHVSAVPVVERAIDPVTGRYTGERGNSYTVERYMGIPYDMEMRVDIWTSNEDQKHQFMEQVLVLFNPGIDLQSSTNPIDWTALTTVFLTGIEWTNRSFPIADDDIEISSLTFKMPIWLNPPAKIKRQNIIHQIITNIATVPSGSDFSSTDNIDFSQADYHTRVVVTPKDHLISVAKSGTTYEVTLLDQFGQIDSSLKWLDLLNMYGTYRPGVSQLRLKTTDDMDDHDSDVIGAYSIHPTESNKVLWTPDLETLPRNTLRPIDRMITLSRGPDFAAFAPGIGPLPAAAKGQRYLLAEQLLASPGGDNGWGNLAADVNDIIEYDGSQWFIAFDASQITDIQYLTNTYSTKQLKWNGEMWIMAIETEYRPGGWRIFL